MKEIANAMKFDKNEIAQKKDVLAYLKSFEPQWAAGMLLVDEVTKETMGEGVEGYEDGEYFGDSRDIYHFEKYNLILSEAFIKHVISPKRQ